MTICPSGVMDDVDPVPGFQHIEGVGLAGARRDTDILPQIENTVLGEIARFPGFPLLAHGWHTLLYHG